MKIKDAEKLAWIAGRSLINCHVEGVDSILFDDTPGRRVRVFIANKGHQLWRNTITNPSDFSVALHPHHCGVLLVPIYGTIYNILAKPDFGGEAFNVWAYQSQITTGAGRFINAGFTRSLRLSGERLYSQREMTASEIHSMWVPREQAAAWFVYEGADDPAYMPLAYLNAELDKLDFGNLYQPMSIGWLEEKLEELPIEYLNLVEV